MFVWDINPGPGTEGTWNVFFMGLSLLMAIIGSYTAIQFIETLMAVEQDAQSHTSKKSSAGFSVFAASWCIAINCVWVMHFLNMSAVSYGDKPVKYNLFVTVASMAYIFCAALLALSIITFHKGSIVYKKRKRKHKARQDFLRRSHTGGQDDGDLTTSLDTLRREIKQLLLDLWEFLSLRLAGASILLGTGVGLMHFTGMQAMRLEDTDMTMHPVWVGLVFPLAWVGGAAILFLLYHMHGFRRRLAGAVVIGVAVNAVHYCGFFAGTFTAKDVAVEPGATSEVLVEAEMASVVVSLLSSIARFIFMGTIAAGANG